MLKVYRRTLSLLLAVIILLPSSIAVYADESAKYKNAEKLLVGLNIVSKDEADVSVTRGRFADIFAKAMNIYSSSFVPSNPFSDTQDSEYYEAIEILHDRNYISGVGDNNFAPENVMRVEDIARLYVCALGLEKYPESLNISFWTAANRLGLLKNVSYTGEITMHNLMIMTYNLLAEAPIGKMNFDSGNSFSLDKNDNLLYQNFRVVKETGTVSENSVSGVWSTSSVSSGYVKIKTDNGTITALEGDTDISNYLGYKMNVYIEYGDVSNRVICYEESVSNDACIINISDIRFESSSISSIVYATNGGGTGRASIASLPAVIFNGVYYNSGTFDLSTLKKYEGTVTLIKSGSDSDYDIVSILAYTDYFVSNVEYYDGEMRIFDKGANSKLILNESQSEIKIYHPNGAEASMYELQANTILTVIKSADSKKITIYICDDTETKEIASVKLEERLVETKDGEGYRVSASYPIENIEVGKNTKIYFDYLGNIGWVETDADHGYSYAIVCSARYRKSEDKVVVRTFIKSGEFTDFVLAEKVKIDGISYKDPQEQADILKAKSVAGFQPGYYPMRYILDDDGLIRNIDTPEYNNGIESRDSLRTSMSKGVALYTSDGILAKQFVLSASTKVFVLPTDASTLDNYEMLDVGGKSLVSVGQNDNVMAFQTKEGSMYANLVVVWKNRKQYAKIDHENSLFLIDRIRDVYDESLDEVVKEVSGIESGVEKVYRVYQEPALDINELASLSKGDVVRFSYYRGGIYDMEVVYKKASPSDPSDVLGTYKLPSTGKNGATENDAPYDMYFCGYVRNREENFLKIFAPDGNNLTLKKSTDWKNGDEEKYLTIQANNIAVYDPKLDGVGKVYIGDIEDIPYYDGNGQYAVVIMKYRSRSPKEIVVIKQ